MASTGLFSNIQVETVAELRELYRAAEARAARLRLLSSTGQELALSDAATIRQTMAACADRLAHFLGKVSAAVHYGAEADRGLSIRAPGQDGAMMGRVDIPGVTALEDIADSEDRQTVRMALELMGASLNRFEREQEVAELMSALREREQRLEYLVGRLFSGQEDERRRLSQELHDGVAQTATALARLLERGPIVSEGPDGTFDNPERSRLAHVARGLVTELRRIISGLRPTLLDDLGLEAAILSLAEALQSEGYEVETEVPQTRGTWAANLEIALFRVAQEAVSNIRKHAGGPCRVVLILDREGDQSVRLVVRDYGQGITEALMHGLKDRRHIGLEVMQERMTAIGGELNWQGDAAGVTVMARYAG